MKKRFTAIILSVLIIAAGFAACGKTNAGEKHVQDLNYEESIEEISNPDQGFYRPVYVKINENGAMYNKDVINSQTQLYHLRCDISAFSAAVNKAADKPVTDEALKGLDALLFFLKENDKNAIVRFAYDPGYSGSADKEPALDVMLGHVESVCSVLNRYVNTVTAIETGLIGPWGEMHTSAAADPAHITPIINAFLTAASEIPVLVRTPEMIYNYINVSEDKVEEISISPDEKAYRLGLYNDGYLGSESDLGTYINRERDINFLSVQNAHLPFGGEVTVPDSPLHNIEACLPEMNKIHLSYLNTEWDNRVIEKWKKTFYTEACGLEKQYYNKTAFTYIQNRLGYRFVLKNSVFTYSATSEKLNVRLKLQNLGFGNLNRNKRAKLIFTDSTGAVAFIADYGEIAVKDELEFNVEHKLESGKYDVYLRIYGEELQSAPLYCVKFANDGLWNDELKANKIGSFERIPA